MATMFTPLVTPIVITDAKKAIAVIKDLIRVVPSFTRREAEEISTLVRSKVVMTPEQRRLEEIRRYAMSIREEDGDPTGGPAAIAGALLRMLDGEEVE